MSFSSHVGSRGTFRSASWPTSRPLRPAAQLIASTSSMSPKWHCRRSLTSSSSTSTSAVNSAVDSAPDWDLDQTASSSWSPHLARPQDRRLRQRRGGDEEDLALLEARDLLFARLLQYRAYKEVPSCSQRDARGVLRFPRAVGLEERFARCSPRSSSRWGQPSWRRSRGGTEPAGATVATAIARGQGECVERRCCSPKAHRVRNATFRALTADCATVAHVVARFLALLDLYRERTVTF